MSTNILDAVETNIALPKYLAEKIERTNYSLTAVMHKVLARYSDADKFFGVSLENMETFKAHPVSMGKLMNMPFLALSPALQDPRDWETFVDGIMLSPTVEKLTSAMPAVDDVTERDIFHYNCTYVSLLKDVLHQNLLAAPLLGISFELADYLIRLPIGRLEAAVGAIRFPLYRWRFDDKLFWIEYAAEYLTEETVAHYIMRTSNLRAGTLPYKNLWSDLRLERAKREVYARLLMTQGCRASTATNLFALNSAITRNTYRQIHGVSSPCGNSASSLTWYVERAVHRLQATMLVWLYRCALKNGANIPEALIVSNDVLGKMFGTRLIVSADRANHLTRSMAMDSRLNVAPCRSCGTDYILSNDEGKIELAKDFVCPGCEYHLKARGADPRSKGKSSRKSKQ
ncbi:Transcriptional activator FlhC [Burkholderia sp. 8Y]|uniref:FlhC family transcriptional regulator n=1 Tax=Burkholderia sp. 8Y TaxID=2653133 RepID=UPI0012F417DD|nr:FlhC family transcriptional regulator [Burkholderia sp. 8Y]VXC82370.1 Transcriptional activator FlhC [Burkholderia sp. 8Y]